MPLPRLILLILLFALPSGLSWAEGQDKPGSIDPWEGLNRKIYVFNDTLDQWVVRPVAKGYKYVMPDLAEQGITNFILNIYEFNSFFNSLLQGEFVGATHAGGRFLVNTTLGLLGFVDVATPMGITPFRADFGQTLAVWGVDSGPFLVMPLLGPTTPRDRVQTRAATSPSSASSPASIATVAWMKNAGASPFAPAPHPRRSSPCHRLPTLHGRNG